MHCYIHPTGALPALQRRLPRPAALHHAPAHPGRAPLPRRLQDHQPAVLQAQGPRVRAARGGGGAGADRGEPGGAQQELHTAEQGGDPGPAAVEDDPQGALSGGCSFGAVVRNSWLLRRQATFKAPSPAPDTTLHQPSTLTKVEFKDRPIDLRANKAMADAVCSMFK